MNVHVNYLINRASESEIAAHFSSCDDVFISNINKRINIDKYVHKIYRCGHRFEAWANGNLIGLIAIYCNDPLRRAAFVTSVSVLVTWRGRGVASHLVECSLDHARELAFECISLEVDINNFIAISMYKKFGFKSNRVTQSSLSMDLYF